MNHFFVVYVDVVDVVVVVVAVEHHRSDIIRNGQPKKL